MKKLPNITNDYEFLDKIANILLFTGLGIHLFYLAALITTIIGG
jgi:hypothetical protein